MSPPIALGTSWYTYNKQQWKFNTFAAIQNIKLTQEKLFKYSAVPQTSYAIKHYLWYRLGWLQSTQSFIECQHLYLQYIIIIRFTWTF